MSKLSLLNSTLGVIDTQSVNVNHLILEAHREGLRVNVYANEPDPAFHDADAETIGSLNDQNRLKTFASRCQWVIYVNSPGINEALINYVRRFTSVPQGSKVLDLINDQSIQRVFLDTLSIKSLPYDTVFTLPDVKRAVAKHDYPFYVRPVQTDYLRNQAVLITDGEQLSRLSSLFNGEAYLLESLPKHARYFSLTTVNSRNETTRELPAVEIHYRGQTFDFANLNPNLSADVLDRFSTVAKRIMNHLDYVGAMTISFILTGDDQIYVDGIDLPFKLVNNVFNRTADNVYQLVLRSVTGAKILPVEHLDRTCLIKSINHDNVTRAQDLWSQRRPVIFDLRNLIGSGNQPGYALMSGQSLKDVREKLQKSQL